MSEKHDDKLFEILKEEKNLVRFFESIFGFLSRRTDFYVIAKSPQDPLGLPKGYSEQIVYNALKRYTINDNQSQNEKPLELDPNDMPVIHEEICETTTAPQTHDHVKNKDAELKSDNYNGATYNNYSWSQSITDMEVHVTLPLNYKDLQVTVTPTQLAVRLKNEIVIEGEFQKKIRATETLWSIDKNILQIHLEKFIESWWERLLVSEPMLDLQQMDCSRPIEELTEEAQVKLEHLRWDAEQKNRGLPTSSELKRNKLLEKAWDAEGSPFKGIPFDPNLVPFES